MADTAPQSSITPATPHKKPRQGRSPAFPFISLEKALERAETFRVAEGGRPKHFAPLTSAARAWGIGVKTGTAIQTVAALGHYGLFEFEGSGDKRNARLTETAFRILLDKQPVSPERNALLQKTALEPPIHAELWQKWESALPSQSTLETYLVRDRGFSEKGARDLIAEYKDTLAYAKLIQPSNITPSRSGKAEIEEPLPEEIEVGDLIQIELNGAYVLEKPARVRAIQDYEGQPWVFIDGTETGFPMEQAILDKKGQGEGKPTVTVPRLPLDTPSQGTRKEVFALDEGDVVLTFPENLSAASFHDLEGYLALFLRKAQRRAMAGDFFVEIYASDGLKAKERRYFDDFASAIAFVEEFKKRATADKLRVNLPARATDEDRQRVAAIGGLLV